MSKKRQLYVSVSPRWWDEEGMSAEDTDDEHDVEFYRITLMSGTGILEIEDRLLHPSRIWDRRLWQNEDNVEVQIKPSDVIPLGGWGSSNREYFFDFQRNLYAFRDVQIQEDRLFLTPNSLSQHAYSQT